MAQSPWKSFSQEELSCKGSCPSCFGSWKNMSPRLMQVVQYLRDKLGFQFKVTSAYRCPARNQEVSSTGVNGPHTTGKAIDIACSGSEAYDLVREAQAAGITGIGVSQKGPMEKRFIHLDILSKEDGAPRPTIWTY